MTDTPAPLPTDEGNLTDRAQRGSIDLKSDAARQRIRKRYRSETIFKSIGVGALVLAGLFLVTLFWSIIATGLPAFVQTSLKATVNVSADSMGLSAKPTTEEIRSANYFALARNHIRGLFPDVTKRRDRIKLSRLLSSGSTGDLRAKIAADPSLIGKKVETPLLFSDDADIYLKGGGSKILKVDGRGIATPTATTGDVIISTSSNDFAGALVQIKKDILNKARKTEREANAIERRSQGGNIPVQVEQMRKEAAELRARYGAPRQAEQTTFEMSSVLVAINGGIVKVTKLNSTQVEGIVLRPLKSTDAAKSGEWSIWTLPTAEANRKISDQEIVWLETLKDQGAVQSNFNWRFFTAGDSREPELAGIRGAITGSLLMLLVTLSLCLPIGVMAAIYLEEFAPRNWITDVIEININNLAAVPSIVFGLLGLAVFLNFFGMPRSAPVVGGCVLALMTLPTIIISSRAAIRAVPPSIREGALGVGASHQQAVFHHVLPLAMPGIMTGTIVGMAQALGETAPLLMIGMVAFIVDIPGGFTDPATVLPVQIFLWSDLPEVAFRAKTSAAIIVLLLFLFLMNGAAILMRKRFERRW